jgi:dihydrofolate reductase
LHRHVAETLAQADALLFGRVTYEMMEAAFRPPARTVARPDWMEPFARTIDAAKKYVVSRTRDRVDWNVELVRGDLGKAVQQLKRESGNGLLMGGVRLPLTLAELGLIDEYEFLVQPRLAGHGPTATVADPRGASNAPALVASSRHFPRSSCHLARGEIRRQRPDRYRPDQSSQTILERNAPAKQETSGCANYPQ